jgi:hypothetical protein
LEKAPMLVRFELASEGGATATFTHLTTPAKFLTGKDAHQRVWSLLMAKPPPKFVEKRQRPGIFPEFSCHNGSSDRFRVFDEGRFCF